MVSTLWQQYLNSLWRRTTGGQAGRKRRRTAPCGPRVESLECRMLLSNIDAKLILGGLHLTGLTPGTRNVTISPDATNPAIVNVTPGADTTINGSTAVFQFPASRLTNSVFVTFNTGLGGSRQSTIAFNNLGSTLTDNVFVTLLGKGGDSVAFNNSNIGGSLFSNLGGGNDSLAIINSDVGGLACLSTSSGSDSIDVQQSDFSRPFHLNAGLRGGDTLSIDDATFNRSFSANLWKSGNTINVEQDTTLAGATTFNGPASFNYLGVTSRGGGGDQNIGRQGDNTQVVFNSRSTFVGAHVTISGANTVFSQSDPKLIFSTQTAVAITTTTLPAWTEGLAGYNQTINTIGGTGPLLFSVSQGTLPAGLTLNANSGVISGQPAAAGNSTFTVKALDTSNGEFATQPYTLVINAPVLITTTTLPDWTQNQAGYNQTVVATGGTGARTFALAAGSSLPAGLTLSSAGVITGTPTAIGSSTFTVQATDSIGASDTQQYTVAINAPVLITTTTLPDWTQNQAGYNQTV
ncbi:MAG: hypothetical protein EHM42_12730, partial [Planctomycetaceae bacterium]